MRTEQESKVDSFSFEASIGMEDKDFSGDIGQFKQLHKALDAVVKKFGGSDIPCNFGLEGKRPISWNFMIDEEDLDEVLEKLDQLEGDFGNDK